jgi:streptomycin 6-kinase
MSAVVNKLVIPDQLMRTVAKEQRDDWLAALPELVARVAADWQLKVEDPFLPGGETAWVAPVRDGAGNDRVLKVGWRHPEADQEADGLRAWAGDGAVRLHQDRTLATVAVLLLERCRPGTQLRKLPPDEHDIVIAGLLRRLWREPPPGYCFRPLSEMCDYWASRYEERSGSGRDGLSGRLARSGIDLLRELSRQGGKTVLLHTDLHAGNVLAADRERWLAIDPKPYVGDPTYDVTQHIFNGVFIEGADPLDLASRMAGLLDLDGERIRLWLFARAVEASPYWEGMADLARSLAPS